MLDYKLLEALDSVVREQGFDKAAQKLFLTQSAVSQRIKLLEEQMGQVLVTRTTPLQATRDGRRLLKHYLQVKNLEEDFLSRSENGPKDEIRVFTLGINADSLATWFLPAVEAFLQENRIVLDLKIDDQEETLKMLRNGEVAGCVSARGTPVQGCRVIHLGTMIYRLAATPEFAGRFFPDGLTVDTLEKAPAVIFNRKDDLHDRFLLNFNIEKPGRMPVHYVPSSESFARMIVNGTAYGMIPDLQGASYIREGVLKDLAPEYPIHVDLFWHHWSLKSEFIDAFSRAIVKNAVIC